MSSVIEPIPPSENWLQTDPCTHPEHNPPMHIVIPPGSRLKHRCPGCGKETNVYPTPRVTCSG